MCIGVAVVGVYLMMGIMVQAPERSAAATLLALVDGPIIAAVTQSGRPIADTLIEGALIDIVITWLFLIPMLYSDKLIPGLLFISFFVGSTLLFAAPWLREQNGAAIGIIVFGIVEGLASTLYLISQTGTDEQASEDDILPYMILGIVAWIGALMAASILRDVIAS